MKKYLFICLGNIARSQMAQAFYNHSTGTNDAYSAGVLDVGKKYGGHPTTEIVQAMKELGIDVSKQEVKQFTKEILDNAETIVVLCAKDETPNDISDRTNVLYRHIEDPFGLSMEKTREIRDTVKSVVDTLISQPHSTD